MATFYKYAEKEADSYINWADIGKNMSDMLLNENKIREEKKAALDEESRKYGQILSNPPQGDSKQLNQYSLEFAAQLQDARLMQDKLLKSGQLKLKDYLVMRQNTTDGTSDTFNVMKEYQQEFKEKMERAQSQDPSKASQDLETFIMSSVEGFANFNKSQLYINPTDGKISVALKEKKMVDGKEIYVMSSDPNNFATVASLRNRIKGKYDLYDVPKNVGAMVDRFGVEINSFVEAASTLGSLGTIRETLDITNRKNLPKDMQGVVMGFEKAETIALDAQLQNHFNVTSILTNTLKTAENGKPYGYTYNPKERDANPNMILLKEGQNGPEPDFEGPVGEKQYIAARERLRLEARLQYDKKSELKSTSQLQSQRPPSQGELDEKAKNELAMNFARQTAKFLTGETDADVAAAQSYFTSQGAVMKRNPPGKPAGIYVQNPNGEMVPFKLEGQPIAIGSSLAGALLKATGHGDIPDTKVVQYLSRFMGKKLNTTASGEGITPGRDIEGEFNQKVIQQIKSSTFQNKGKAEAASELATLFKDVPNVKIEPSGNPFFADINITYPTKKGEKTITVNSGGGEKKAIIQAANLQKALAEINDEVKAKAIGPEQIVNYGKK